MVSLRDMLDLGIERSNQFCCYLKEEGKSHQWKWLQFSSIQSFSPTLCDPMNCSMPGLPVHHQLPEFTQTHIHRVSDATQPSHPLSSPSSPAPNPSKHQGLFQWVNSSHEVTKVLEFQLQHQSFQQCVAPLSSQLLKSKLLLPGTPGSYSIAAFRTLGIRLQPVSLD